MLEVVEVVVAVTESSMGTGLEEAAMALFC